MTEKITSQPDEVLLNQSVLGQEKDLLLFNNILSLIPGPIYWKNRQGFFMGCNQQCADLLGLSSPHDIMNKTLFDLFPKQYHKTIDRINTTDQRIMDTGIPEILEEESFCQDVTPPTATTFLSTKTPLFNAQREIIGLLGMSINISPQKKQQESKSEAVFQMRMQDILDALPGHVDWQNRDGVYLGCNPAVLKLFGCDSLQDFVGKTLFELCDEEHQVVAREVHQINQHIMASGKASTHEEVAFNQQGERATYLTTKTPLFNRHNEVIGLLDYSVDITAKKILARTKREKAITEQTIEQLKTLAACLGHELKTPLTAIKTNLQASMQSLPTLIEHYKKSDPLNQTKHSHEQLDFIEQAIPKIYDQIAHSNTMIDMQLKNINYSDPQTKDFINCSIQGILAEAVETYPMSKQERERIHFKNKLDFHFKAPPLMMKHLLWNLLKNALYYIKISHKGEIFIWTEQTAEHFCLYFKDTSQGIEEKILPHIFDRFFTCRTDHNGTGLGLALAKSVMQAVGGNISCESMAGEYTTFILQFTPYDKKW